MRSRVPAQVSIVTFSKCNRATSRAPTIFNICSRQRYLLRNTATSPVRPDLFKPHLIYPAALR